MRRYKASQRLKAGFEASGSQAWPSSLSGITSDDLTYALGFLAAADFVLEPDFYGCGWEFRA